MSVYYPSNRLETKRHFYHHVATYVGVIAALAVIVRALTPDSQWLLWVAAGWGVIVLFHGIDTLSYRPRHPPRAFPMRKWR